MGASVGDPIAIKASDWNRLLQSIRDWQAPLGNSGSVGDLPCLKATIRARFGERRPCLYEVVDLVRGGIDPGEPVEASLPLGDQWKPSSLERQHVLRSGDNNVGRRTLEYRVLRPKAIGDTSLGDFHQTFAVCLNPSTLEFAVSGFALARVRFHSQWHTYARRPMLVPGDSNVAGNANPDVVKYTGCLDSTGSGPAKIIAVLNEFDAAWGTMQGKAFWAIIRW